MLNTSRREFGPILRASPSSFLRKEPALRDYPKAADWQSGKHRVSFRHVTSYTPSPLRGPLPLKGTQGRYGINFPMLSPAKHDGELAAFGGFSPFGAFGTTFPPLCGGTTTRTMLRATYRIIASRSFIVPPLAGGRWWRQPPRGDLFPRAKPGCKGFIQTGAPSF